MLLRLCGYWKYGSTTLTRCGLVLFISRVLFRVEDDAL